MPTPLKFFNRIVGTPGELTYAKDIYRYYEALDKASDRITMWRIGKTEEGRDMVCSPWPTRRRSSSSTSTRGWSRR